MQTSRAKDAENKLKNQYIETEGIRVEADKYHKQVKGLQNIKEELEMEIDNSEELREKLKRDLNEANMKFI